MKFHFIGHITAAAIQTPGTGYTVGDIVTVAGGNAGTLEILAAPGGVPTTITIHNPGTGYNTCITLGTTGGTGAGLTVFIAAQTGIGFAPVAGSGMYQQHWRCAYLVKKRTIHSPKHPLTLKGRWANNNKYFSRAAEHWAKSLTGAQRTDWDNMPHPTLTSGFEKFMSTNKAAQGKAFTQPSLAGWNSLPAFPLAPTTTGIGTSVNSTFPPNTFTSTTIHVGVLQLGLHIGCRYGISIGVWKGNGSGLDLWQMSDFQAEPVPDAPGFYTLELYHAALPVLGPLRAGHKYRIVGRPFLADASRMEFTAGLDGVFTV